MPLAEEVIPQVSFPLHLRAPLIWAVAERSTESSYEEFHFSENPWCLGLGEIFDGDNFP